MKLEAFFSAFTVSSFFREKVISRIANFFLSRRSQIAYKIARFTIAPWKYLRAEKPAQNGK